MARPRRAVQIESSKGNKGDKGNSSSSNGSATSSPAKSKAAIFTYWKEVVGFACLVIAATVGYQGYLETRVNTPFDDKKVVIHSGIDVPERFWGSYRPGTYFGLKTRDPHSLVAGLMWYNPKQLTRGGDGIKHWCEQSDNLKTFGWIAHDGANFGIQEIHDGNILLTTSFVKRFGGNNGGDWTARISVDYKGAEKKVRDEISLIWYTALDDPPSPQNFITTSDDSTPLTGVKGHTHGLGDFSVKLFNHSGAIEHESFVSTVAPGLHMLKETVLQSLRLLEDTPNGPKHIVLGGEILPITGQVTGDRAKPNFIATQVTARAPFTLDVVFESGSNTARDGSLLGETYTTALDWHRSRFEQRFEDSFGLQEKGYGPKEIHFAQAALSNMIGGIGYFYGASRVQSAYTKEPVPSWKAPLYTAVPSRSFFPRGFLWDEGFHGFLIATWDIDIELDIISHWFDLINVEGWIPREQILGVEALAKVPEEFVTQRNNNANPPTFFLTLQYILRNFDNQITAKRLEVFEKLYPRLQAWFHYFNTTQKGESMGTYRWHGRDATTVRELNPKTLASGLDDFPRASHPTDEERHIDMRCWIALAADILAKISAILGRDGYKYDQTALYLMDNELMDKLHWSDYAQMYADYGLHTDSVMLKRPKPNPRSQTQSSEMVRVTLKSPEYRLVDSSFGYISLFPFLLQLVDETSPKLGKILADLEDRNLLWTDYGLRSLAKNSPMYMKRNTEHDPPYWRGPIWININFLAIRSLDYYAKKDGPYQEQAQKIYTRLRKNVIDNVIKQYYKSGYIWEQYNDTTGEGSGCRPFTGWSALVVLLMGEKF